VSDAPIVGRRPDSSDDEQKQDGVVLFDPTPRTPIEVPDMDDGRGRLRPTAVLLVLGLVAVGAVQLYGTLRGPEPEVTEPPPPVEVQPPVSQEPVLAAVGGPLTGTVGASVVLEVRATGAAGQPLADTLVRFEIVGGTGEVQSAGRTDARGVATAMLQLPPRIGHVLVEATVASSDLSTRLSVEVLAGAPQRMEPVEGNEQDAEVGELLPVRPSVRVLDAGGNPVRGADVRFAPTTGGGQVAPSRTRTDSLGLASALWRLGMDPGQQELTVSSIELPGTVTFGAMARSRPVITQGGSIISPTPVPVRVRPNPFVIGGSHACVLEGGRAVCRGTNDRGQAGASVGTGFVALATGISHTCALDAEGVAVCWGANEGGQLGDGSRTDRTSPVPVSTNLRFESLTAGTSHTCGIAGGGLPVCWGENLSGQLGDRSRTDARFPRAVGGGVTFSSLEAGWSHTCGLTSSGNAFCWGLNSDGQLGDGSRLDRLVPTLVRGAMSSLAAGSAHTCGVSDAQVLCWGSNRFGQLGDGTNEDRMQPVPVQGLPGRPQALTSGAVHACALLADGSAYCWGQNLQGQLGDGTTENRNRATRVAGGVTFRSLVAGGALTCGFATDGTEYCWGFNQNGQLGDGTRENRTVPTAIRR